MPRIPRSAAAMVVVAAAIGGCGSSRGQAATARRSPGAGRNGHTTGRAGSPRVDSTALSPLSSVPPVPRIVATGVLSASPPVDLSQSVQAPASTLTVDVAGLHDPLLDSGAALLPGARAVGVEVTIADEAGATYDSTASGDWSLQTTAGRAAPLFIRQGVCETPLTDFESLIGVGETRSGCVGFSVSAGARIVTVTFSPNSRSTGSVSWAVSGDQ
ncbi:MAG: hypothetical protein ACLPZR_31205 [Solirubrobacteraceae bacterium]